MIRAAHLTEDQWFDLCLRVYKLLRDDNIVGALGALEGMGFDDDNLQED